jgi:hypothetical protein
LSFFVKILYLCAQNQEKEVMKRFYLILMALTILILSSGEEKKKIEPPTPKVEVRPLEEIPGIFEAHGTIGDGSSMNVIEFINDDGDTLYITKNVQSVMGGLVVGDEIDVIYNVSKEDIVASVAVNLTTLQHLWTQKGADGREQSLELDAGGRANTYNMSVNYDEWEVKDGLLLLHSPKKVGDESPAVVDSFEILQLTTDSLVLMHGNLMTEFKRYN